MTTHPSTPETVAPCSLVRVEPSLWRRYRRVRLAALQESPRMFGSSYQREIAFEESEWRRRAARVATFLVERGGQDVGMAGVYRFDTGWCVMGMWVHPGARGCGAVDALLRACVQVVREHGGTEISLLVMADNPRGIRAYQRNGFTLTGRREVAPDGRAELVMARGV
ncbi:GNAT family N-acetyltransferase [Flexivirga sp.]|uniref:GNAT family N-acetyltransferase n=1 Tax=Flexivirga sp. TaxID=1962927 RepID=UPI003F7EC390